MEEMGRMVGGDKALNPNSKVVCLLSLNYSHGHKILPSQQIDDENITINQKCCRGGSHMSGFS
jgi:hypothetical protein